MDVHTGLIIDFVVHALTIFLIMVLQKCHRSNWWVISRYSTLIIFRTVLWRSVVNTSMEQMFQFIKFVRHCPRPMGSMACEPPDISQNVSGVERAEKSEIVNATLLNSRFKDKYSS